MDAHPSAAVTRVPEEAKGALTPTPVSGSCARSAARRILRCFPGSCFNPACLSGALRACECTAWLQAGLPSWHPQASRCGRVRRPGFREGAAQPLRPSWLAWAPTGHPHGARAPGALFHLEIGGCGALWGWSCPLVSGPALPACAVLAAPMAELVPKEGVGKPSGARTWPAGPGPGSS